MCTGFGRGGTGCLGLRRSDKPDGEDSSVLEIVALREPWVSLDVDFRACHAGKKNLNILVFLAPLARA